MVMSVDIETYSGTDLSECGVYKYVEDPDFGILLIAYSVDGGEACVIDCTTDAEDSGLQAFKEYLLSPDVVKHAYNANFERVCLAKWLGVEMPPEQWRCTMVRCLSYGLPGALADAGASLGLSEEKLKDPQGKALINYFCKPCKPTKANGGRTRNLPAHDPAKWELFKSYNRQDVVTEMAIADLVPELSESEQRLWALDQRINDRGVRVDVPMAQAIARHDDIQKEELLQEAREITGLSNPNSVTQLKGWLQKKGVVMESLAKDALAEAMGGILPEDVRRVLWIRSAAGKTSTAKYKTMLSAACEDGRIRGVLQFYGANRSGRWAGRLVQVQNLARNNLPDLDLAREIVKAEDFDTLETLFGQPAFVFSELVRTAFIPSEGCRFVVSDFSAIEARVLAWIAGEEWVLEAFRAGKDIYCEAASQMYCVTVEKHGQNKELRAKGKLATLACGYQGGVGAMKRMDSSIPEEEMQSIVNQWRKANPRVVKLWKLCEAAARTAIEERRSVRVRTLKFVHKGGNLHITLPSGRVLSYYGTKIKDDKIVYMGVNQTTKAWTETETYGGKLVENIVQATARDCLAEAMQRVTAEGYKIVMHIHDEIVVDAPVSDWKAPEVITKIMSSPVSWAYGLPLKGDTYETDFYKKD